MAVLISDHISGWEADSRIERAVFRILSTQISFKFRRGDGERKCNSNGFRDGLKSAFIGCLRTGNRADL